MPLIQKDARMNKPHVPYIKPVWVMANGSDSVPDPVCVMRVCLLEILKCAVESSSVFVGLVRFLGSRFVLWLVGVARYSPKNDFKSRR